MILPTNEPLIKLTKLNDHRAKYQDVFFAGLFLVVNIVAFGMQMAFIVRGTTFITWYNCLGGAFAPPISLLTDGVAGVLRGGGGHVLALAVTSCCFFSALWIYSLRSCAKFVVWSTYILGWFGVLSFVFYIKSKLSIAFIDVGFIFPTIFLVVSALGICYRQESINRAARVISTACRALGESPCLFLFTFVLQVLQLAYFAFYMFSAVNSYYAYPVLDVAPPNAYGNEQCGYVDRTLVENSMMYLSPPRDWVYVGAYFSALVFLWNVFFGDAMRLYVTTGVMGEWFFNAEHQHRGSCGTVARFWKWALTVQLGTIAVSAIVSAAIQKLKNWAKINGCCCCCPHVWIARIVLFAISSCVGSLTRFNLAYAALSGEGFSRSVRGSFGIVFSAFGDAITNELTAALVMNFGTLIFSCGVGLLAWAATAYQMEQEVFVFVDIFNCAMDMGNDTCSAMNTVIHTIMFGFSGWVAYNTLLGFFLLIMFPMIWTSTLGQCVYMGVLSMLIARLIFTFVGGLILDSTTGMYMCAAIDKQNGTVSPKRHYIDEVMKEEHCPLGWYTVVATQPASAVSVYTTPPAQFYQSPIHFHQPPPPPPVSYQYAQQHQPQFAPPPTPYYQTAPHPYQQAPSPHTPYQQPLPPQSPYHQAPPPQPFQPSVQPSAPPPADAPPPYVSDTTDFIFNCKSCQTPIADDARFCAKCGVSR